MESEIKRTISLTFVLNKLKYAGTSLIKYVQNLCVKNCKILMSKIKEKQKWNGIPCSWIGKNSHIFHVHGWEKTFNSSSQIGL